MTETTTPPNVADVEEALRDVVDPELGINVVDLGLERVAQARADRALVVLEDELLVEVHQTATSRPNIAGTRSRASRRASTSPGVE